MKTIIQVIMLLCVSLSLKSQVPQAFKYQAVVHTTDGQILSNQDINVQIRIFNDTPANTLQYVETHFEKTNAFGLISFNVGEGQVEQGSFDLINWKADNLSLEVLVDEKGNEDFRHLGRSRLLSVPYALRAKEADNVFSGDYNSLINQPIYISEFINDKGYVTKKELAQGGDSPITKDGEFEMPRNIWVLEGNFNVDPKRDKLGTNDMADLIFKTNDTDRMIIRARGHVGIYSALTVGDSLKVDGPVELNRDYGNTTVNGNLHVENESKTFLSGDLTVENESKTLLSGDLTVDNQSKTLLSGQLEVQQDATFKEHVTLDNANHNSTNTSTGALVVAGGVGIAKDLNVGGIANLAQLATGDLSVTKNTNTHVATFTNTNTGNGDGIKIKLGKNHGAWNNGSYLQLYNPLPSSVNVALVKSWLSGGKTVNPLDIYQLYPNTGVNGAVAEIGNVIIDQINSKLGLPKNIVPEIVTFPGFSYSLGMPAGIPDIGFSIPSKSIGPFGLPDIPKLPVSGIPNVSIPNLSFTDVSNSLSKQNEFVSFVDKDERSLGSIRAQSVTDWKDNTIFSDIYVVNLASNFIGVDLLDGIVAGATGITNLINSYNKIGVEYASGHGDYAEWLERIDIDEQLSAGDIVAVKGGKITKDLANAEQVMVVSYQPIVLGNVPAESEVHKGNNVAFMGQIPVKVLGPVRSGDYIVASHQVKGYGQAISPEDMTADEFKYAVGRSWQTNELEGPKVVHTVVGVHNGDWVKLFTRMDQKLNLLESKIELINQKITSDYEN